MLVMLVRGMSNAEITQELVISVNTVKTHIKGVYRKLQVNNRRAVRAASR